MTGTGPSALAAREVDLGAIGRNVRRLLQLSGTPLMAVVKADAFGHGAVDVARTAVTAGATWLGVATVDEALELRAAGLEVPIFAWLVDPWSDLDAAVLTGVTLSCANRETLDELAAAAQRTGTVADVHLELDTGMARGGSTVALWDALCVRARDAERAGHVRVTGLWTHLACASVPGEGSVRPQMDAYWRGVESARGSGLWPSVLHAANSAGALAHDSTRLTLVRAAAAIYGIETVAGRTHGLEPALRVTSRVTQVRAVEGGTGVGYSHTYRTVAASTLALVPMGYGDGVPRQLSEGGHVMISGTAFPVRGTISMDQLVVEVDDSVRLGDEVVLLGDGRLGEPDVASWARQAGTIPHDILTRFGSRVVRRHVDEPDRHVRHVSPSTAGSGRATVRAASQAPTS